jgi:hypothetical protein
VSRLWSRVSIRVTSVALLVTGVIGGVYLGQDREVQQRAAQVDMVAQADQAELDLLKERHAEHAAARAPQRKAEADAAGKAAREAKAAAERARTLEAAVIEKDKKDKAAKDKKDKADAAEDTGEVKPFDGPIPESCAEFTGSRAIGCAIVVEKGLGMEQFACLNKLFAKESGWNPKAKNRSSGAFGIPQALPGNKMASAGADWATNPATQIRWGLSYIAGRYKTPCGAWAHSQSKGWY